MNNSIASLILLSLLFSSCAYTRVVPLNDKKYPSISESEVTIFVDIEDLPAEFEKVALITTDYDSGFDKVKWNSVKKKCATIGCNGVYQKYEDRATQGEQIASVIFGLYTTDKAEFIAIRYDDSASEEINRVVGKSKKLLHEQSMSEIRRYLRSESLKDRIEGIYAVYRTTIDIESRAIVANRKSIGKIAILHYQDSFFDVVDYYDEERFSEDRPAIIAEVELDSDVSFSYRTFDSQSKVLDEHLIIEYQDGFEIRFENEDYSNIDFYIKDSTR